MIKEKSVEKYLWIAAVLLTTYLILGSFIVEGNINDLIYLIILYGSMLAIKIESMKE